VIPKSIAHGLFINYIHLDVQQLAKVHDQPAVVQQRPAGLKPHYEIQVGAFLGVASRYRTDNPHVMGAVPPGDFQDRILPAADVFTSKHAVILLPKPAKLQPSGTGMAYILATGDKEMLTLERPEDVAVVGLTDSPRRLPRQTPLETAAIYGHYL
jgi:hypothetical protein